MIGITFNTKKIKECIDAYFYQNEKFPYLIMNEKTREIIPEEENHYYINVGSNLVENSLSHPEKSITTISLNDKKYVEEPVTSKPRKSWYNAKILIDNDLEFGEVHIG